jgi:hypothetical protein
MMKDGGSKIRIRDQKDSNPEQRGKYNDSRLLLIQFLVWNIPGYFKKQKAVFRIRIR